MSSEWLKESIENNYLRVCYYMTTSSWFLASAASLWRRYGSYRGRIHHCYNVLTSWHYTMVGKNYISQEQMSKNGKIFCIIKNFNARLFYLVSEMLSSELLNSLVRSMVMPRVQVIVLSRSRSNKCKYSQGVLLLYLVIKYWTVLYTVWF